MRTLSTIFTALLFFTPFLALSSNAEQTTHPVCLSGFVTVISSDEVSICMDGATDRLSTIVAPKELRGKEIRLLPASGGSDYDLAKNRDTNNAVTVCGNYVEGVECPHLSVTFVSDSDSFLGLLDGLDPHTAQSSSEKEPLVCGGVNNTPCGSGWFCEKPAGVCDGTDTLGECVEKHEVCTREFRPVCGCDGKSYGNDCVRIGNGVLKKHDGECAKQ